MKPRGSPGLWLILAALLVAGLLPLISGSAALREILFTVLLSVPLASSLNIILGYTGYISFGHVVFFGLGGYVGLYLISAYGASLWVALPAMVNPLTGCFTSPFSIQRPLAPPLKFPLTGLIP